MQGLCCPSDQMAAIVTMRSRGRDPWFVAGVTVHLVQALPGGCAKFEFSKKDGSQPNAKVVILKVGGRINLPQGAQLRFLRFKGTRAVLAICYKSGSVACRAANVRRE